MSEAPEEAEYLGKVTWYSSEEGGGPDCGISICLGDGDVLYSGEITRDRWEEIGGPDAGLGDDSGYWLIHYAPDGVQVLGKYLDREALDFLTDKISEVLMRTKRSHIARAAEIARDERLIWPGRTAKRTAESIAAAIERDDHGDA